MKIKLFTKKKIIIGVVAVLAMSGFLFFGSNEEQIAVRNREYIAQKDNITVGVETSGQMNTLPNAHTVEEHTVMDDVYVKLGSEVKKGDPLALISLENLNDVIQTAKDELSDAKAALLQVSSEKDLLLKQNAKNKQDGLTDVQQDFESKLEQLNSDKTRIEKSITADEAKIKAVEMRLGELSKPVVDMALKIDQLKSQINANVIKIGALSEKMLKVDDGSSKRQALNLLVGNTQYELQSLNTRLNELVAMSKNNQLQIEAIEAEIKEKQNALMALEKSLGEAEDEAEITELLKQIQVLQSEISEKMQAVQRLSYSKEIESVKNNILTAESRIRNAQIDLNYLTDGSVERNNIRIEMTKIENENTALQQELERLSNHAATKEHKDLKSESEQLADQLAKDYNAFSLKLEEILRTEQKYQQSLEKQGNDNTFADYKVRETLKAINETISKANIKMKYAEEKLNQYLELEKNPTLYAQMDGVVTALNYKNGDVVTNGKPVCIIGKLSEITMTVPVSAADIGSIVLGQKVNIFVDAFSEQKFTGVVSERLLVANDNGDYLVTITLDPSEQMILPGMKAFATIILKEKRDVLTISNKAILIENGIQYVNLKNDAGELVKTKVITGFSDGRVSEVLEGLSEHDIAIVQE